MLKNQPITKHHLFSQKQGNIVSDMDGEKVMLNIYNGKYYNLGELGGYIWELMEKPLTHQNLVTTLQSQYDVDHSECEEQVTVFLNQLIEEDLIQIGEHNNS